MRFDNLYITISHAPFYQVEFPLMGSKVGLHDQGLDRSQAWGGGGTVPYMGHIGMCRCEGYGFHAVYSRIGFINQSNWL